MKMWSWVIIPELLRVSRFIPVRAMSPSPVAICHDTLTRLWFSLTPVGW